MHEFVRRWHTSVSAQMDLRSICVGVRHVHTHRRAHARATELDATGSVSGRELVPALCLGT